MLSVHTDPHPDLARRHRSPRSDPPLPKQPLAQGNTAEADAVLKAHDALPGVEGEDNVSPDDDLDTDVEAWLDEMSTLMGLSREETIEAFRDLLGWGVDDEEDEE